MALSLIYDGESRSAAARFGGVGLQIVRDWVLRFNAHGVDGLVNGKAPGRKPLLNDEQRVALAALVDSGPQFEVDGTVRWRLCDLMRWIAVEFGIKASRQTVARELRMIATANCLLAPGIMRRIAKPSPFLKRLPCRTGRNPCMPDQRQRNRNLVSG
ncbi:transposase [Ochrobactrum daejeonense]|uniref:Transposase n=1 Tax=Brucella daejeonensis TaxID=659015 RepID=A0A7W9AZW2_9HYPH|nr:transposase [Brucella daejeonensis]